MNIELRNKINPESIIALNTKLGYKTFYDGAINPIGYNLNIGVVRAKDRNSGTFNDIEFIMYQNNGLWNILYYSITADPSRETLINLPNKLGAAIVVPGQYEKSWKLDFHKGKKDHPALVQVKPISVIRDFNKDNMLDFDLLTGDKYIFNTEYTMSDGSSITYVVEKSTGKTVQIINKGLFGINNHRASRYQTLNWIGAYSQGCMVHNDYNRYMDSFIKIITNSALRYGLYFTITIYTEEQFNIINS